MVGVGFHIVVVVELWVICRGPFDGGDSCSALAVSSLRRLRARGLRTKAAIMTRPSITITAVKVAAAIMSNLGLKMSERSENTPPSRSIVMKGMEIPTTSLRLMISQYCGSKPAAMIVEANIPKKSMARRFIEGRTANTNPASNAPIASIMDPAIKHAVIRDVPLS